MKKRKIRNLENRNLILTPVLVKLDKAKISIHNWIYRGSTEPV